MKHLFRSIFFVLGLALVGPTSAQGIESYIVQLPTGLSLIANQLDQGGNTLNEIMPGVPDGSRLLVYGFDPNLGPVLVPLATYSSATASWSPSDVTLPPGKGVFFENNSQDFTLTFTGTRRVPVPIIPELYQVGTFIVGAQTPESGLIDKVLGTLVPCGVITISKYNRASGGFESFVYDPDAGGWTPSVPSVYGGEAVVLTVPEGAQCQGGPVLTLSCPLPKEVQCGTDWTFDSPTPLDACQPPAGIEAFALFQNPASVVINVTGTITNGLCPMIITRSWEATDGCGNRATCSQTVTVTAPTPPQIVCAADKSVECGVEWSFDAPTVTDGCDNNNPTINVLSTVTNGTCPATITRTWEVVDSCGNRATCSQTVNVAAAAKGDLWIEDSPYNYNGAPDLGREPDGNMDSQQMWLSRGIWVHQTYKIQDAGTYLSHENPRFGQTNGILVNIGNRGSGLVNGAQLKVYVANASLGLSWPDRWKPVGTYAIPAIASGGSHIAELPWWPEGTGHYCLVARIVSEQDPMFRTEGQNIGVNVRDNNNLAWRNVNVVNLLLTTGQSAEVRVKPVRGTRPHVAVKALPGEKPPRQPVTLRCQTEALFHEGAGEATINMGPWFKRWQDAGGHGHGFTIVGETTVRFNDVLARIQDIPMDEDEEAIFNLVLVAPRPMPVAGTEHTCHVELTEEIDGEDVGGVNYGVRVRALHTDSDKDGIVDAEDLDDDGDGVPDVADPDPLGEPDCPPSALTIRYVDGNMVLSWNGLGYRLQGTSDITRAWHPLPRVTSPYIVAPTDDYRFFRLVCH